HLYEMDYLKEGIGLRAMAQRDPLVEYQREGFDMFTAMLEGLKEESVGFLFNLQVEAAQQQQQSAGVAVTPASAAAAAQAAPSLAKAAPARPAQQPARTAQPAQAEPAPAALRAKGLDETERRLTYTGPDEDGRAHVARTTAGADAGSAPRQAGTRKERRAAARRDAKTNRRR
ncbi:MAG: preprotein translocase subunit SecA, partial [Rhodococcus sp. (in: high G+C Gram-positive bacteria)]